MIREVGDAILFCNVLCTRCCVHAFATFGVSDEIPEGDWEFPRLLQETTGWAGACLAIFA